MAKTKETLETLSRRIGYSKTTISRVLNGKSEQYRISKKAENEIRREAELCGFTPNRLAQSLRIQKTNTIGLVLPDIDNPFFATLANHLAKEAMNKEYMTVLIPSYEQERLERIAIRSLIARGVDGIILVPAGTEPFYALDIASQVPIVLCDRYYPQDSILPYVVTDNYAGACMAVKYLIDKGHERIACIRGPINSSTVQERVKGYLDTLNTYCSGDYRYIAGDDFSVENGYLETKILMSGKELPSAIFAQSNTILLGVIKALRELGKRIPEDISIIAFDENIYMDYLSPSITRIGQPSAEIGTMAIKQLCHIIEGGPGTIKEIKLPPALIIGNSVKSL